MKVLIGVDPHKASVAVAVVGEAKGELLERASFLQSRAGLGSLERWARRFPERRWAVENACGLGRHLAGRLATSREERLAAVDPEIGSEVLRLLSERREDLVAERTRALNRLHGLLRDLVPGGVAGSLRPTGPRASCAAYGPRAPRPASAGGWLRRCCATSAR
jgi:transposase